MSNFFFVSLPSKSGLRGLFYRYKQMYFTYKVKFHLMRLPQNKSQSLQSESGLKRLTLDIRKLKWATLQLPRSSQPHRMSNCGPCRVSSLWNVGLDHYDKDNYPLPILSPLFRKESTITDISVIFKR